MRKLMPSRCPIVWKIWYLLAEHRNAKMKKYSSWTEQQKTSPLPVSRKPMCVLSAHYLPMLTGVHCTLVCCALKWRCKPAASRCMYSQLERGCIQLSLCQSRNKRPWQPNWNCLTGTSHQTMQQQLIGGWRGVCTGGYKTRFWIHLSLGQQHDNNKKKSSCHYCLYLHWLNKHDVRLLWLANHFHFKSHLNPDSSAIMALFLKQ